MQVHYCLRHPERSAAARCMACGRHFCRECVTEHGGRFTCSECLGKATARRSDASGRFAPVLRWMLALAMVFAAWIVFGRFALALLDMSDVSHSSLPDPN